VVGAAAVTLAVTRISAVTPPRPAGPTVPAPAPAPAPTTTTTTITTTTAPSPAGTRFKTAHGFGVLPVPRAASGEGILSVIATPWGHLYVDGRDAGDTPRDVRLPAGPHRVRIERRSQPTIDEVVTVNAGARTRLIRR
jgi:hypothetical protein